MEFKCQPWSQVINFFILNSTEHGIYHAHNVKMPIFISMNNTSEISKQEKSAFFQHLSFNEQLNGLRMKQVLNLRA